MNTHLFPGARRPQARRGNVMLLTVVAMGLISFLLVAYLRLVQGQNSTVMRSQAWNGAMPVIEAGIEDALTHINTHGSTNLACDGWVYNSLNRTYSMTRYVGNSFYVATITNYVPGSSNTVPFIDSKAYVVMPTLLAGAASGPLLAQANTPPQTLSYLGRGVRVSTGRDRIFAKGMVARDSIDLNGNTLRVDSFDSGNPALSTNGLYTSKRFGDNGDIAVNGSILNQGTLSLGNAKIYGRVATGPGGLIQVGANGRAGSTAWHDAGQGGIQPGWSSSDMNVSFPPVPVPYPGGFTPAGGHVTNLLASTVVTNAGTSATTIEYPANAIGSVRTNYPVRSATYPTNSPGPITWARVTNTTPATTRASLGYPAPGTFVGLIRSNNVTTGKPADRGWYYSYDFITGYTTNWTHPTFTWTSPGGLQTNHTVSTTYYDYVLRGGDYRLTTLIGSVYVEENSRLYVDATLRLTGLTIKPGKRLDLYCNATEAQVGGQTQVNSDGRSTSFYFWGTTNLASLQLNGNAGLTGAFYAPNAAVSLNGGGQSSADFSGALVARSVTMNGHFNFHYDEALGRIGPDRGWHVTRWTELHPAMIPKAVVQANGSITFR
ncbi:MAG: hypothetical protein RJA22_1020 [Verrucomicrobiota bacterium]|jgi:hypothetical protein